MNKKTRTIIVCEIDSEYFSKEEERFAEYTAQTSLFR